MESSGKRTTAEEQEVASNTVRRSAWAECPVTCCVPAILTSVERCGCLMEEVKCSGIKKTLSQRTGLMSFNQLVKVIQHSSLGCSGWEEEGRRMMKVEGRRM